MRIWIITENWPPRVGGIERYLTGIASNLAKNGHEITVFAPPGSEEVEGSAVLSKQFFHFMIPKWFPLYVFLSKKAREQKPDVILCGKALFEGRLARMLNKKYAIPYIVCTYGMEIATWQSLPKTKQQLQRVLADAHHVLTINKKTRAELEALGVSNKKLSILHPGINPDELSVMNSPDEVLQQYNITQPYILTVSRLVKRKGIDDLIVAFSSIKKSHPRMSLIIAGDGPEKKNLEHMAKEFAGSIKFLGALPDRDIHALYSRATLFALPPKELPGDYEGFGIVYCEAAFFSLPVVATQTGGVSEAIDDAKTGLLVEAGNTEAIADAIISLLDNPELATHYGKAGRQRVMDEFQWTARLSTLEHILTTL